MQVACYVRVSSDRQAQDGYSLAAQRDMLAAYCARQGWADPRYYADEGRSALSDDPDKRPAFRQLLTDAEARLFAVVVTVDLDRFSRSTVAALTAASRLERVGCRIVSLNQPGDFSTPDGELMFTVHASLARYESRQKGRRVAAAFARMRAEGKWLSQPPYGARIGPDGALEPDPATAPILARILTRAAVASFSSVADDLTRDGIPVPGSRRSPGQWGEYSGHWWPATVSSIVRKASWLATQDEPWPTLWLAALGRTRQPRVRGDGAAHMLTGLMRCRCGALLLYGAIGGRNGHVYGQYAQCAARRIRIGGAGCPYPHTYAHVYEEQVVAALMALPDAAHRIPVASPVPALAAWQELAEERRRLRVAWEAGLYTDAELAARARVLREREAALPRESGDTEGLGEDFDRLRPVFTDLAPADQNAFLRRLLVEVRIFHRTAVCVWRSEVRAVCGLPDTENAPR